jgi:two-component system sensor histidine kinase BaeS
VDVGPPRRRGSSLVARLRSLGPTTFQGRLTIAFVAVVGVTLLLVTLVVVNRLGDYFDQQQKDDLEARSLGVAQYVAGESESITVRPVVDAAGIVDPAVVAVIDRPNQRTVLADTLAQADVVLQFGLIDGSRFVPSPNGRFAFQQEDPPLHGQQQESITSPAYSYAVTNSDPPYAIVVTLSNPYTYRAAAISNVTGLLAITGLAAMAVAVVVATTLARRFTTPLRRLTEASRGLEEGDLARRVPPETIGAGASELDELGHQFNTMADRLQESVDIIRRDRDRSRDFLADVSHELRTPIAALRTFNELLAERAGSDPETRAEFLEASKVQLERLDWLAQNLLELSKLDSGLVLLDLRPDDLRSTVEQAIEQAEAAAERRGIALTMDLPDHPIRIRHDPVRIGQVVANLVANAIKFTDRGGSVRISVRQHRGGARIVVADTGVGIDAAELPKIFDRFYRGTRANEARATGSGLGLAIVRSIVDMHQGTVTVESRLGSGTTFTVMLPRDPRGGDGDGRLTSSGDARTEEETRDPSVAETSPSEPMDVNTGPAS